MLHKIKTLNTKSMKKCNFIAIYIQRQSCHVIQSLPHTLGLIVGAAGAVASLLACALLVFNNAWAIGLEFLHLVVAAGARAIGSAHAFTVFFNSTLTSHFTWALGASAGVFKPSSRG